MSYQITIKGLPDEIYEKYKETLKKQGYVVNTLKTSKLADANYEIFLEGIKQYIMDNKNAD